MMRWLVLGYMQAGSTELTDAPTLTDSTVKMMVAMGNEKGDLKNDEISTGEQKMMKYLQGTLRQHSYRDMILTLLCHSSMRG